MHCKDHWMMRKLEFVWRVRQKKDLNNALTSLLTSFSFHRKQLNAQRVRVCAKEWWKLRNVRGSLSRQENCAARVINLHLYPSPSKVCRNLYHTVLNRKFSLFSLNITTHAIHCAWIQTSTHCTCLDVTQLWWGWIFTETLSSMLEARVWWHQPQRSVA